MNANEAARLNRHDLAVLTPDGREWIAEAIASRWAAGRETLDSSSRRLRLLCAEMLCLDSYRRPLPGIVRRREDAPVSAEDGSIVESGGVLALGFVFPNVADRRRLRVPCRVPLVYIEGVMEPDGVACLPFVPRTPALRALAEMAESADGCRLGVWGSCALEIYTGYPYTDPRSDLDLLLLEADPGAVGRMLSAAERVRDHLSVRIDIEVRLPDGFGVNARELMEGGGLILAKGLSGVRLMPRDKAWRMLER